MLLDRDSELGSIEDALRSARTGEGAGLLIEGPAGIGKSALLEAAAAIASGSGMTVASAAGSEAHEVGFGVARMLLAPVLAESDRDPFGGAAGVARPLFAAEGEAVGGDSFSIVHALYWLCASLSERRPLVLLVDDVQWADELSIDALTFIAERIAEIDACVIMARRSGERDERESLTTLAGGGNLDLLRPEPLGSEAVAKLVETRLGAGTDRAVARAFAEASGGNPLFLRELLRSAESRGADNEIEPTAVTRLGPETIGRVVEERLDGRSSEARSLARALAILGEERDLDLAAAVAGTDPEGARAALDELVEAGLVEETDRPSYSHTVVRRIVHDAIPDAERSRAHVRAASALSARNDTERAAAHLVAAGSDRIGAEWVVPTLLEAGRNAGGRGARAEAEGYLLRALAEEPCRAERYLVMFELGLSQSRARDPAAVESLAAAREDAAKPVDRARSALAQGQACFYLVRLDEAARTCRAAIAELDGDEHELALMLEAEAMNADRLNGVEQDRPREIEPEVRLGRTPAERAVLVHVAGEAVARGDRTASEILGLCERAWGGGSLMEEVGADAPILSFLGTTLSWAEDFDAVFRLTRAQIERGRSQGSLMGISYGLALQSGTNLRIGDLARAESEAELVVSSLPASDPLAHMICFGWLLEVAVARGRADEAKATLAESGLDGPLPDLGTVDFLLLARGDVALACGDPLGALEEYEEVGRRAERALYLNPAGLAWRSRAAIALTRLERHDDAGPLAREEVERARRFGAPRALGIALRALAASAPNERVETLREAVDVLGGSGARLELARALVDLGVTLGETGAGLGAREPLAEGMDLAHHCGALALVDRAMGELRALGARPRRPAVRGVDALTPQERRVAQRVAEGRSNREVAEELFLTRRTVEMHLTNVYRKLSITSRAELPKALG